MYRIHLHKRINQINELFYGFGLWHRRDEVTVRETILKLCYSIYYLLYPLSIMAGVVTTSDTNEALISVLAGIIYSLASIKALYIIWKKKQISELLHRICVFSIEDNEEFTLVSDKLKIFMRFVSFFLSFLLFGSACDLLIVPFLGSEKKLFVNIAFPLDWRNNEIAYWIAFAFVLTEGIFLALTPFFSVVMWYLMLNCALKYEILGKQFEKMDQMRTADAATNEQTTTYAIEQNLFLRNLFSAIRSHQHIRE